MAVAGVSPGSWIGARPSWPRRPALRADHAWRHGPSAAVNRCHAAWTAGPLGGECERVESAAGRP